MAKPTASTRSSKRPRAAQSPPDAPPGPVFLPPLRPNRKLFFVSAALVAACLALWLTLYITTVRH